MKLSFVVAVTTSLIVSSVPAVVQAKTAKECTAEWRAAKADFQAKGAPMVIFAD